MINFSKMRFLVVDDFSEFRSSIRSILGLLAVQKIDTAASGEEVLELCRRNRYDVILHDYNLGDGLSGQQVLEQLHAEKLLSPHSIFIMVTAENTQAMVLAAIECEPDDYLSKPFNKVALQTRLERIVRRKQVLAPVLAALERGDSNQVLQACQAVADKEPRHAPLCQRYKADALYQLNRFDELEQLLEQQARSRPANWNLQRLARLWLWQDKRERLGFLLDAALRQFPLMPELHDIRAEQAGQEQDLATLVQSLQKGVALSPNTVRRQISLACHAWLAGQPDVAVYALRQCWEVGRHSLAFDAELIWQLASILQAGARGRTADESQHWLKILERQDLQTPRLQPLSMLLRMARQAAKGTQADAGQLHGMIAAIEQQLNSYAAITLLQLGDWLTQLGEPEAAAACWGRCAARHAAIAGVPEQLAKRLPDYDVAAIHELNARGRKARALYLTGEQVAAGREFAAVLQQMPEQIGLNMAAARFYSQLAAEGDSQAHQLRQDCLQRIGRLSPLEPQAHEFSRMNNPLETSPW